MQDALIMSLGVEQRKRLTIGVELAAKPSLLLFLDEPTSGLDSQSAYSIVRFLKKLAAAGQAIVCTIHQPSSILIQQFDMILALNPGGNTFYFGPVGENGSDVIKYFGDRGVHCPEEKNVAEFILETAAKPVKRPDGTKIDWNEEWRNSQQAQDVIEEIEGLKLTRSRTIPDQVRKEQQREFAAPVWTQIYEMTVRTFKQYWRDPSYIYGKLFVSVIVGIFNGFTFWQLGNTIQDMQNRMFTAFLIITIPPTVVNAVVPKFFTNMALWQAREYPSRIYGWVAFTTAQVVAEVPWAILSAVIYFVIWYYPTGLPTDSSTAGYVFLMTMLFFLFQASWGQWITAFAPSFTVISNVLLRHVLALQRCRAPLLRAACLLAVLDVLRQPLDLVDRRRSGSDPRRPAYQVCRVRDRRLRPAAWTELLVLRRCLRRILRRLPSAARRHSELYDVPVLRSQQLPRHPQHQPRRQVERLWHFPGICRHQLHAGLLLHLHRPREGLELRLWRPLPLPRLDRQHDQGSLQGQVQEQGPAGVELPHNPVFTFRILPLFSFFSPWGH
jgi:hypothetical protein